MAVGNRLLGACGETARVELDGWAIEGVTSKQSLEDLTTTVPRHHNVFFGSDGSSTMESPENAWVMLLTAGLGLIVVGLLVLETASSVMQYGVLGLGVATLGLAVYVASETQASA